VMLCHASGECRSPRQMAEAQDHRSRANPELTATGSGREERAAPSAHSWDPALLAEIEPGRRNRRTVDAGFLLLAAIVIGLTAVVASSTPGVDRDIAGALATLFGWADALWRAVFVALLVLAVAVVVDVLLHRRWSLAFDLLVAVVPLAALGLSLGGVVESDWFPVKDHLLSRWGYPELRLATATAVLVVTGPELVRWARVLAIWLVPFAALGLIVLEAALPSGALGGLAVGLAVGSIVRLAFGSAAGVPPTERIRAAMAGLGVEVRNFAPSGQQRIGAAEYVGRDLSGEPLKARVLGRDSQDTQRLARRWRLMAYRDPPRSAPIGRLEQVEHEALATFMAGQAGVRVPEVVLAALDPDSGDALLVTRQPDVEPLELSGADQVSDEMLEDLWGQVDRLHKAGIAHGRLNASNVLVTDDGPMLVGLSDATLAAPQSALDIDTAELVVACTVLVGSERALRHAIDAGWQDNLVRILPYLQRAALTPHLRDLARSHEVGLKKLRTEAAAATGQEAPEVAPLRRIRPRDLLLTAALIVGAYLLISKLAQIGFGTIYDQVKQADPAWVVIALILAQCSFIGKGVALRGAVATPLPLLPCVVLQSAIKFINLTVPSSAGRIGMNLRFLQRLGASGPEAAAAGALDDVAERVVQAVLFGLSLVFVGSTVDTSKFHLGTPNGRLVAAILIAVVASVAIVLAVPRFRAKIVPPVRTALAGLWTVMRDRHKRLQLNGGNLVSELFYSISLGATCLAYGVHLDLAQLIFVNTAASVLSSLIPSPGGIGAAEASLSAGLIAMGVGESTAFAIAITQRLSTFYLPPIWGYASLRWLNRKGYL
jgi:glycosyltransferase 2 family protein